MFIVNELHHVGGRIYTYTWGFPAGAVVENPPANDILSRILRWWRESIVECLLVKDVCCVVYGVFVCVYDVCVWCECMLCIQSGVYRCVCMLRYVFWVVCVHV